MEHFKPLFQANSYAYASCLLHRLEVIHGQWKILGPAQLVHHAAVVEVRRENLQKPDQLQWVLLQIERDGLVVHFLVANLYVTCSGQHKSAAKNKKGTSTVHA